MIFVNYNTKNDIIMDSFISILPPKRLFRDIQVHLVNKVEITFDRRLSDWRCQADFFKLVPNI